MFLPYIFTVFFDYVELPSHYCTAEELNLEKSPVQQANVFFPIAERYERDMEAHNKKFLCLDQENMRLQGDYSSETASLLEVRIEKCVGHDYCRDEKEIDDFFKADKYIIMLNNQIRFNSELHNEDSIIKESVLYWMPPDTEGLFRQQYQLRIGESNLQDLIIDLDSVTEFQDDIFEIKRAQLQPRVKDSNTILFLSFEVLLDLHQISREHFSVLDLMGDIGGVQAILISFFQFILFFLNYRYFDSYMASKLYKIKKPEDEEQKSKTHFERSDFFKPGKWRNLCNYMQDSLPDWLKCCKETRQERAIKKAITEMDKEINIIDIVKSRRFTNLALRKLLSHKDRMDLKERSRYLMIDPDSGEDDKALELEKKLPVSQFLQRSSNLRTQNLDAPVKEENAQHTSGFTSDQTSSFDLYHEGSISENLSAIVEENAGDSPPIANIVNIQPVLKKEMKRSIILDQRLLRINQDEQLPTILSKPHQNIDPSITEFE